MLGLKLEHVRRRIYNTLCDKVSEANYSYSAVKIKYDGDQNYGNVSISLAYHDNDKVAFNVISMLYETYCELNSKEESE